MYKKTKLDNGIRIITHPMPKMQSAALGIWIKAGGRYESGSDKGISHYLEHLLFKGSKKYSCRKLKESIEGVGGSLNGFTSEELTCYLAKLPSRHLNSAIDILSDMVINPLLLKEEVEKERTVILEEAKMYKDQPQSYVHELLDELLWPNQPLGMPIIGFEDSIRNISRDDLYNYKERYYTPVNIVVSIAGCLEHNEVVRKIKSVFGRLKAMTTHQFIAAKEEQAKPKLKVFHKDTEQTHLALGFHAYKRDHPLEHALGLLHIIMGANMSSRLFDEIREKRGLAYEIGTGVRRFQDTGVFLVHAGIDNRKVTETVSLILEELNKVKDSLVRPDEFKRAKEFYLGQLRLSLENTMDSMLWIGETMSALDKTHSLEDIIREVNKVRREDVQDAAVDIFQAQKLNLALIGPLQGLEGEIDKCLQL